MIICTNTEKRAYPVVINMFFYHFMFHYLIKLEITIAVMPRNINIKLTPMKRLNNNRQKLTIILINARKMVTKQHYPRINS